MANKIQIKPFKCAARALCRPGMKSWPRLRATLHDDNFETFDLDRVIDLSR